MAVERPVAILLSEPSSSGVRRHRMLSRRQSTASNPWFGAIVVDFPLSVSCLVGRPSHRRRRDVDDDVNSSPSLPSQCGYHRHHDHYEAGWWSFTGVRFFETSLRQQRAGVCSADHQLQRQRVLTAPIPRAGFSRSRGSGNTCSRACDLFISVVCCAVTFLLLAVMVLVQEDQQ